MKSSSYIKNPGGDRNKGESVGSGEATKVVRFINLVPPSSIQDVEILKDIINSRGFTVDFSEFKITSTKVQKRLINAGQKDGPRERVSIEEKVDINSNYKYLRQISWRVLKEVNNVLLVQMGQIKGIPCSLPLVFSEILAEKRKILVAGLTNQLMVQLISKPDLKFKTIPEPIAKNNFLKQKILERADREKSMQAIARSMQDFSGIDQSLREKLAEISSGNRIILTDEEAVNVILIADLYTRYLPLFQTFQNEINSRSAAVAALSSQFVDMTQGMSTEKLIDAFKNYLIDDDGGEAFASENNSQLFSYLYKKAQTIDEKRLKIGDMPLTRAELFGIMRSMISLARSQIDPDLWKQCLFFFRYDDINTSKRENINTVDVLISDINSKIQVHRSASTQSLLEIHLINNIHRFITGRKVLISKSNLTETEMNIIRSVVVPNLYQPGNQNSSPESVRLFLGMQDSLANLINPIHTVSRVYGFLIGRRLRESVQKFLKPGLRELLQRFGGNFFSIFFEMVVQETGIPISRNQFAQWLESKQYFKNLKELGYIANKLETHYDSYLKTDVLMETGESCFSNTYSEASFKEDYLTAQKTFNDFINSLRKEGTGFSKILSDFLDTGNYNLKSQDFHDYVKKKTIYKTFQELVIQSCVEIKFNLKKLAVSRKVILKIPLEFESLLLIEKIFPISVEEEELQLHLIAIPVKSADELEATSKIFSKNFITVLKRSSEIETKELLRANRILRIYQKVNLDYIRYISISIIDRQINSTILKIRQQKNQTPNHIKYHFTNYEKLIIGNVKKLNLGKLIQIDKNRKSKEVFYSLAIAEVLQAVIFFRSANHKIRDYRTTINQISQMMERYTSTLGEDYHSLTYIKQIKKFDEMLATSIDEFSENVLNLITILAKKIHKTVRKSIENNGVMTQVYKQWQENNPSREDKIGFYVPFMRENKSSYDDKLFSEIAKAREILLNIKRRKCLIIIPDKLQEDQLRFIIEIGTFIKERDIDIKMYVEVGGLSKDSIEELSKVFYPGNFFRIDRLKPVMQQT
ncbi:hypothetical protein KJ966_06365 [bacterium]|nr:hypothetical protein [bacterium]